MNFEDYLTELEAEDQQWKNVLKLFRRFKIRKVTSKDDWTFPVEVLSTIPNERYNRKTKFFQITDTNVLMIFPYKMDQLGYAIYINNDMSKIIKKGTEKITDSNAIKKIITISGKQPRKRDENGR